MKYTADTEAMQAYSRIVGAIAQLDLQRQELVRQLQVWEQEHQVPDDEPTKEASE
jgi:hypothetical protein